METESLQARVGASIPPIPFKGISEFFDIAGMLARPALFQEVVDALAERVSAQKPDVLCALDARGFLLGAPVSLKLGIPLVMIRKQGKLPGNCVTTVFSKEYETGDTFEMQCDAIKAGDAVVILDDVLATGGSMLGAFTLVRQFNPRSVTGLCLMNLHLPSCEQFLETNSMSVDSLFDVRKWKSS